MSEHEPVTLTRREWATETFSEGRQHELEQFTRKQVFESSSFRFRSPRGKSWFMHLSRHMTPWIELEISPTPLYQDISPPVSNVAYMWDLHGSD